MQAVNLAEEPDIRSAAVAADTILITLESDFGHDGQFGKRTLEVTGETVRVLEAGGAPSCQIPSWRSSRPETSRWSEVDASRS
jgi:hypothetical protein